MSAAAETAVVPAARRELTAAVLGAAVAGGLALLAGGQPWADVTTERRAPLPPVTGVLSGVAAAPLVPATGLVLLAAAQTLRTAGAQALRPAGAQTLRPAEATTLRPASP